MLPQLTQEQWNEVKKTGARAVPSAPSSPPILTEEEKALAEKWGITDLERATAFGALDMTLQDIITGKQTELEYQMGKPARMAKILTDSANIEPDPYAKDPFAPVRVKRQVAPDERNYSETKGFQSDFNKWFLKNRHLFSTSCFIELKATPDTSIPFNVVRPSQHEALRDCSTDKGVYHQIVSDPYKEQTTKPADSVFVRNGRGYIAVMFNCRKRANFTFYMIRYEKWMEEEAKGERKSLRELDAQRIGKKCQL